VCLHVCVIQRRESERPEVTTDRRVSCYAGGSASRRNTRSSLNAVCTGGGRSALNTRSALLDRDAPVRQRYVPNVSEARVLQANSTAVPLPPPDAAARSVVASTARGVNDEDRPSARGSRPRRPITVTVLSERRLPSSLPVEPHPRRPRSPSASTSDDKDRHQEAAAAGLQVDVVVSPRNNHHICDSGGTDAPPSPSSTPPQQRQHEQQQQHIV